MKGQTALSTLTRVVSASSLTALCSLFYRSLTPILARKRIILAFVSSEGFYTVASVTCFTCVSGVGDPHRAFPAKGSSQAMLLMEELFFMPFWGMPAMAGRSSGMTGVSFLCRLASRESCTDHPR